MKKKKTKQNRGRALNSEYYSQDSIQLQQKKKSYFLKRYLFCSYVLLWQMILTFLCGNDKDSF